MPDRTSLWVKSASQHRPRGFSFTGRHRLVIPRSPATRQPQRQGAYLCITARPLELAAVPHTCTGSSVRRCARSTTQRQRRESDLTCGSMPPNVEMAHGILETARLDDMGALGHLASFPEHHLSKKMSAGRPLPDTPSSFRARSPAAFRKRVRHWTTV